MIDPPDLGAIAKLGAGASATNPALDAITRLAASVCGLSCSVLIRVCNKRMWCESASGVLVDQVCVGLEPLLLQMTQSGCSEITVGQNSPDGPKCAEPLTVSGQKIHCLFGVLLVSADGRTLGALFVMDVVSCRIDEHQKSLLRELARDIVAFTAREISDRVAVQRLARLYRKTPGLMLALNSNNQIVELSDLCVQHLGYQRSDLINREFSSMMPDTHAKELQSALDMVCKTGPLLDVPTQITTRSGQTLDMLMSISHDQDEDGNFASILCTLVDISMQIQVQRALEQRARLDEMTGIPNRAWLRERLQVEMARAARHQRPLSLVMFDADNFKGLNDRHGHAAGDRTLVVLANQARLLLRGSDEVGRIGGEEFALILPETSLNDAVTVADRLRSTIERLDLNEHGLEQSFTISLGVVQLGAGDSVAEAFRRADAAMYAAKNDGRNCVRVWSSDLEVPDTKHESVEPMENPQHLSGPCVATLDDFIV